MASQENPHAFPMGNPEQGGYDGMTLRDYFAGQAVIPLLERSTRGHAPADLVARAAYDMADALLEARGIQS